MMQWIVDTGGPFLALVIGFSFIIFVHELGHFLVAKWVGIRCTQFAIGFGQSLLTYRRGMGFCVGTSEKQYEKLAEAKLKEDGASLDNLSDQERTLKLFEAADKLGLGETEYRLNWMPLGGYVKMLGQEDMDPTAQSNDPRSFNRKPIWARACVISAGVVMNLIFAIVFFVIAFMSGVDFPAPVVGTLEPNAPARAAFPTQHPDDPAYKGLQPGDTIVEVDGQPISDMMELAGITALASPNEPIHVRVRRPGTDGLLTYPITPELSTREPKVLSLGVGSSLSLRLSPLVPAEGIAEKLRDAGVKPGMKITAVDGKTIEYFHQFQQAISKARGHDVMVTFTDPQSGETKTVWVNGSPRLASSEPNKMPSLLGLVPTTRVSFVVPQSAAEKSDIKVGDVIARVGPVYWPSQKAIMDVVSAAGNNPLIVDVYRDNRIVPLGLITPQKKKIGIGMELAVDLPIISEVLPGHSATALNLASGSRILSINETPIENFDQLQRKLQELVSRDDEREVTIGYELNVANQPATMRKIVITEPDVALVQAATWDLSPEFTPLPLEMMRVNVIADGPMDAVKLGIAKTHHFMIQTYLTIARLVQGTVKPEHLRGPIGIVHIGTQVASQGWTYLMFFLGLISVNLVVLNFLPIPIVDGGLMVFLLIEKLKGSPVGPKVQTVATMIGLALIGSIFLTTTFFDVTRLFGS